MSQQSKDLPSGSTEHDIGFAVYFISFRIFSDNNLFVFGVFVFQKN